MFWSRPGAENILALRHIAEHYHEKLMSVNEVAKATSVSRPQLERTFWRHMGCTINQHIVRTGLAEVKNRLAETDPKVVAVAHQTGFTRPSHLFRAFHKIIGSARDFHAWYQEGLATRPRAKCVGPSPWRCSPPARCRRQGPHSHTDPRGRPSKANSHTQRRTGSPPWRELVRPIAW